METSSNICLKIIPRRKKKDAMNSSLIIIIIEIAIFEKHTKPDVCA